MCETCVPCVPWRVSPADTSGRGTAEGLGSRSGQDAGRPSSTKGTYPASPRLGVSPRGDMPVQPTVPLQVSECPPPAPTDTQADPKAGLAAWMPWGLLPPALTWPARRPSLWTPPAERPGSEPVQFQRGNDPPLETQFPQPI